MAESKLCVIMDQLERSAIQEQYNHYESIVKAMRVSLDNTLSRPLVIFYSMLFLFHAWCFMQLSAFFISSTFSWTKFVLYGGDLKILFHNVYMRYFIRSYRFHIFLEGPTLHVMVSFDLLIYFYSTITKTTLQSFSCK